MNHPCKDCIYFRFDQTVTDGGDFVLLPYCSLHDNIICLAVCKEYESE